MEAAVLDLAVVRKLAGDGMSVREIADYFGAKYHTVYQFTRRHAITTVAADPQLGRRKKLTQADVEQVVAAAACGEPLNELAARFGVGLATIQWHVKKARPAASTMPADTDEMNRRLRGAIHELARRRACSDAAMIERVVALCLAGMI